MGWTDAKARVLRSLKEGTFLAEARNDIDDKNLLAIGDVTPDDVRTVIEKANGTHHTESPHHQNASTMVHVVQRSGWYIKFYFVDPNTVFISVHR